MKLSSLLLKLTNSTGFCFFGGGGDENPSLEVDGDGDLLPLSVKMTVSPLDDPEQLSDGMG